MNHSLKTLFISARYLFTLTALFFLIYIVLENREKLGDIYQNSNPRYILLSTTLWFSLHLLAPVIYRYIFRSLNYKLDYKQLLLIHCIRLPAKYIPGGIWHSVAKIHDYHTLGINKITIGKFVFLENYYPVATSLALGGSIVYFYSFSPKWDISALGLATLAILSIIFIPFLARITKQTLLLKDYIVGIFLFILFWIIAGVAFNTFLSSYDASTTGTEHIDIIGIYIFSWAIGFITFIAPQGIGISELVASELIQHDDSSLTFISYLFTFRLIILAGDIFGWLLGLYLIFKD